MMSPYHPSRLVFRLPRGRFVPLTLLGAISVALLSLLLSFAGSAYAAANTRAPGGNFGNPVVRAVDVAGPAIVRLATLYQGHIELDLCGQAVQVPASGNGYTLGGLGSGAFISANGDILTADHVVHIDKASLDDEIFQGQPSASDIATAINAHASCLGINYRVTAGDIANGYVQYVGIPYKTSYSDPRRLAWQSTSYSGPILADSSDDMLKALLAAPYQEATLIMSSAFDENDVAVLHVALTDTPSIQLDDSTEVAAEDQLTIIGFPGNGDVSGNATDLLTPSINTVTVSAIKSGPNGAKLIQVGGNVEHGDSGGPALDAAGHIVGVVSFAGDDPRGSTAFMRSSNNARTLFTSAGVSTRAGTFQKLWEQAFADYTSTAPGHWHKAASELDALSARYPSFKGIQEYRKFADNAAQTEKIDSLPLSSQPGSLIAVAVVVLVIIAVALVVFFVVRRRGARQAVAPAMVSQALPPSPYGPSPYGGYPGNPYGPTAGYGPYGGYAPPSMGGYGGYAPPSNFRPTIGISNVPAGVAAVPSTAGQEVPGSSTLQELATGGTAGRMSLPPVSSANGSASFEGAPATPRAAVGVEMSPSGTTGPASYPPSYPSSGASYTPPSPLSSPSWSRPGGDDSGATAMVSQYYCVNGHSVAPNELYCSICGASRRPDSPYSPYSSRP
ncbi:MAG: trypsin-like peptidase domain-containing protein [Ktedonobacterales bacterium]